MKNILVPAIGAILSGLLMTAAYAAENEGTGRKDALQSAQIGTSPQQGPVSRYNKAKIERNKRAREKSSELKSGGAGTMPVKSGTSVVERDKKRYDIQKRAADRRAVELKKADKAGKNDMKKKEPIDAQGQPPAK